MSESIIFENGIEYLIMDTKEIDGTLYTLFVNINDDSDLCFKKNIIRDGKEYYSYLENEEEAKKVLIAFSEIQ